MKYVLEYDEMFIEVIKTDKEKPVEQLFTQKQFDKKKACKELQRKVQASQQQLNVYAKQGCFGNCAEWEAIHRLCCDQRTILK